MEGVIAGILFLCALGVVLGFPGAFRSLRTRRLIENLPTAKAKGWDRIATLDRDLNVIGE